MPSRPLYTPEELQRRDASPWTRVQAVLAPVQFAAFAVSVILIGRYLATGDGFVPATASVIVKTFLLYAIMLTGSFWERDVYGRYLFAPAFFWEDVVSIGVLALHTAYLAALLAGWLPPRGQMLLALAAYGTYLFNAGQYLVKFGSARRQRRAGGLGLSGAGS